MTYLCTFIHVHALHCSWISIPSSRKPSAAGLPDIYQPGIRNPDFVATLGMYSVLTVRKSRNIPISSNDTDATFSCIFVTTYVLVCLRVGNIIYNSRVPWTKFSPAFHRVHVACWVALYSHTQMYSPPFAPPPKFFLET